MNAKLKSLMGRHFKCKASLVSPEKTLRSLGAHDWQILDMAIDFEVLFDVPMDADKALSLKKVSDWERLIKSV